jgi:hypothetical protein
MANTTTTPNMNLVLPTPSIQPGPTYATNVNTAFEDVDAHDHTSGSGVLIPTAALNINADLSFAENDATRLRTVRFTDQSAALVESADIGCVYNVGGNLYWNNASGTAIQITAGSSLNAASIGGIGGDYITSGASAYYTSAQSTFYFTSSANTPANLSCANLIIAEALTSPNTITIKSPTSLAASYNITVPAALPAATRVVAMSSAGVLSVATGQVATDDLATNAVTTVKITDLNVTTGKINDLAVTTGKINDLAVSTGKIAASAVTTPKLASLTTVNGSSSGAYSNSGSGFTSITNLDVSLSGGGRQCMIVLQSDASGNNAYIEGTSAILRLRNLDTGTEIGRYAVTNRMYGFTFFDPSAYAGSHRYVVDADPQSASFVCNYMKLVAYEIG